MAEITDFQKRLIEAQSELFRFASKLTTDREEVNDLVQETSLKALDNQEKYLPDTNFLGWLYTIMHNIFINNYRKEVRNQTFVDHSEDMYHLNSGPNTNASYSDYSYDIKEIYHMLNSLTDDYRIPFTMHIAGFKYREIADKLKLPLGTVKSRIYFTRQKIQEVFQDLK